MRKVPLYLGAMLLTLMLSACGSNTLFEQQRTFKHNVWNNFTPELFDIEVKNIDNYYHIEFTAAVDTSVYRYDNVPFLIELTSPNGEERQFYGTILLKENGRWRGEMVDGYRVATGRIRSYFSFNHRGLHHLSVAQNTSQYDLEGIHSLTVSVTKAKLDYDL